MKVQRQSVTSSLHVWSPMISEDWNWNFGHSFFLSIPEAGSKFGLVFIGVSGSER